MAFLVMHFPPNRFCSRIKIKDLTPQAALKLEALEKKYDSQFKVVFEVIRQLMAPTEAPNKRIGFQLREKRAAYSPRG